MIEKFFPSLKPYFSLTCSI